MQNMPFSRRLVCMCATPSIPFVPIMAIEGEQQQINHRRHHRHHKSWGYSYTTINTAETKLRGACYDICVKPRRNEIQKVNYYYWSQQRDPIYYTRTHPRIFNDNFKHGNRKKRQLTATFSLITTTMGRVVQCVRWRHARLACVQ